MENSINPTHYKQGSIETIDKMIMIWGKERVATFCEINAFKYRDRAGYKGDALTDIEKAIWYENKAKELRQ